MLGIGEDDTLGVATIFVLEVAAKRGDFDGTAIVSDENHTKGDADFFGIVKVFEDFFGVGIGGDVEIFWGLAQK